MADGGLSFPHLMVAFDIVFEEDNLTEDLSGANGPEAERYARAFLEKFNEGAGWATIEFEELRRLFILLELKDAKYDFDSEYGDIKNLDFEDVGTLWNKIMFNSGGGVDEIYLDQYVTVRGFQLFPWGYSSDENLFLRELDLPSRYEFDDWPEFLQEDAEYYLTMKRLRGVA
jgi:hypothetical protein